MWIFQLPQHRITGKGFGSHGSCNIMRRLASGRHELTWGQDYMDAGWWPRFSMTSHQTAPSLQNDHGSMRLLAPGLCR